MHVCAYIQYDACVDVRRYVYVHVVKATSVFLVLCARYAR